MGASMARNLILAGYTVRLFDLVPRRAEAVAAEAAAARDGVNESGAVGTASAGVGLSCESIESLVEGASIICTSLPHPPVFVSVSEDELLPVIQTGTLVIDFGTTLPSETVRLSRAFRERGVGLLDAPVSGGAGGADAGSLRVFAGGTRDAFNRATPVLHSVGDPETVIYCGASGQGQIVKACNQLMMGLVNAALLETVGLGMQAGVEVELLKQALGGGGGSRALLSTILDRVTDGSGHEVGVKALQLVDYAKEADHYGWNLPLSRAMSLFLDDAERVVTEANRLSPSFLRELLMRQERDGDTHDR